MECALNPFLEVVGYYPNICAAIAPVAIPCRQVVIIANRFCSWVRLVHSWEHAQRAPYL